MISPNGLRPDRIEKWDNFFVEAHRYDLNCTKTFPAPPQTKQKWTQLSRSTSFPTLKLFLILLSRIEYYSNSKNLYVAGDLTTPCGITIKQFFFSETKTKWDISPTDFVEEYKRELEEILENRISPSALIKAVEQVFGYLAGGNLQFGAMSTYDYTWFLKRPKDNPDCLQVSDGIPNSSLDPSVLKCYVYAISLAMEDPDFPPLHTQSVLIGMKTIVERRMMITTHRLMVTTAAATITLIRI
jgi:hypothetical protein